MAAPEGPEEAPVEGGPPALTAANPDLGTAVTAEKTLWYVTLLFLYTNELMERVQLRCNYLILADSVAGAALFTVMTTLLSDRSKGAHLLSRSHVLLLALAPAVLFLCSLVAAVMALIPRIYDYDIELNSDFIARMPRDAYFTFVSMKPDRTKLRDFVYEINVLSRILQHRTRRVDISARLFIAGATSMPVVIALALI
jgi:hypothetical protein